MQSRKMHELIGPKIAALWVRLAGERRRVPFATGNGFPNFFALERVFRSVFFDVGLENIIVEIGKKKKERWRMYFTNGTASLLASAKKSNKGEKERER